jgi:hypothetical protein
MIGFAMPWVFGAALAAALTITALHFLSVRQPRAMLLPTARFIPERDARAVARQAKPSDLSLLLLRVIALLAAGAALAGARCGTPGTRRSSIVVIDAAQRADSAALLRVARVEPAGDEAKAEPPLVLWVNGVADDPGVAIVAAIREAARQARANPSLAELSLTVIVPQTVRSRRGWDAWRGQWPAGIRVVRDGPPMFAGDSASAPPAFGTVRVVGTVGAGATDVVAAAFASRGALLRGALLRGGAAAETADVVVDRATPTGPARATVTVVWPASGVPAGWRVASPLDSVGAVAASGLAVVGPWVRTALPPALSDSVRAIAWWSDGVAAAVERGRGASCVREVAIVVAQGSDLLLSPAAEGLLRALRAPCGGIGVPAPREPSANSGAAVPTAFASASAFRDRDTGTQTTRPVWLATALLALAFVALLSEHIVRRESADMAAR